MLFHFNIYSSLLLPFVIQGILYFFLLYWRGLREYRLADKLLAILVILFTLRIASWMLGFAGWYDSHDGYSTFMFYFEWSHWYAFGPLLWFYFRSVTNRNFRLEKRHWLHFIPALWTVVLSIIIFGYDIVYRHWAMGLELPNFYGTRGPLVDSNFGFLNLFKNDLGPLVVLVYFGYTLWKYRDYRQYILANFSDTEGLEFKWLRNFLIAFLAAQIIFLLFTIVDAFSQEELSYIDHWYSYFAWGAIVYYISIGGYGAHPRLDLPIEFDPEKEEGVKSEPEEKPENKLVEQLSSVMEAEKVYLDSDLTLADLAKKMRTSPTNLSKAINEFYEKNFNDFVNSYRVEEVKIKLAQPEVSHLSLLGVALESGFRSKATFNRAFKKHAGVSPSEYLKSQG
jgi:AraC-like DNA-binding protein